jgi:hypothetical protein
VPAEQRDSVFEEHHDNIKFMLVSVNCRSDEEIEAARLAEREAEAAARLAREVVEAVAPDEGSGEAEDGSGEESDGSGEESDGSGEESDGSGQAVPAQEGSGQTTP